MEIKQGDKVRVSKDAPKIYTPDWVDAMFDLVLKVTEVEDGNAMVEFEKRTLYRTVLTAIPTKYLVKVDAEAKEPKFKVGDRVKFKNIYELQKVKDKSWMLVMFASKEATITAVEDNGFYRVDIDPSIGGINDDMIECKVEPTERTEGDGVISQMMTELEELKKQNLTECCTPKKPTYEVTIDNVAMDWPRYAADLAKELALKSQTSTMTPTKSPSMPFRLPKRLWMGLKGSENEWTEFSIMDYCRDTDTCSRGCYRGLRICLSQAQSSHQRVWQRADFHRPT